MDKPVLKHIVISAVNIRRGGTLTVLRDCLRYLSSCGEYDVTAIVHDKSLCLYEGINYIEIPWSVKGWLRRLWCEYVTMERLSGKMPPVDLWFSLHDTTPRVHAKKHAVYCHTSFPFLKVHLRDFFMNPKIVMFSLFTKYAYRIGVGKNDYLVVQQEWFRKGLAGLTGFPEERIIVSPPAFKSLPLEDMADKEDRPIFFYPSGPDCHKNFETLLKASEIAENTVGKDKFKVVITLSGAENRYACWLYKKWGHLSSVDFHGYMDKEELCSYYSRAACLVFPSRVETWGLPISEFKVTGRPMILADLPYAHETSAGAGKVAFFNFGSPEQLADLMIDILRRNFINFDPKLPKTPRPPFCESWKALFDLLISDESTSAR